MTEQQEEIQSFTFKICPVSMLLLTVIEIGLLKFNSMWFIIRFICLMNKIPRSLIR